MGAAMDDHFLDARRARQEGALNPDAITGNPPHGEIGIVAASPHAQHSPAKFLGALGGAFFNAQVHADGITRVKLRDVWVVGGLNSLEEFAHLG